MYFTPRGMDQTTQRVLDCPTAQRFIDVILNNEDLSAFFRKFGWERIAVCGANHFCQTLIRLLEKKDIIIEEVFDKNYFKFGGGRYMDIPVKGYLELDKMEFPDVFVVTSNFYYNDIVDELIKYKVPLERIISINDVLFGIRRLDT